MEITYVYTKLRKDFGRYVSYKRVDAEVLLDYTPNADDTKDLWTEEPYAEKGVQSGEDFSEHTVNTHRITVDTRGVQHKQGGWPREIDPTDAEHTTRYRKKVERDPGYAVSIKACVDRLEDATLLNNAMDLTEKYFSDTTESSLLLHAQPPTVKVISIFRDPANIKRTARRVLWAPETSKLPKKFVTAFCNMTYQYDINLNRALARTSSLTGTELYRDPTETGLTITGGEPNIISSFNLQNSSSYIYDVNNSNSPDFELMAPNGSSNAAITSLRYSTKDANILFAGLYNGQVGFYDCRKSHHIVDTSPVEISHKDSVYDLYIVKSKSSTEFASISTDGRVLWWDARNFSKYTQEPVELFITNDDGFSGDKSKSRPDTKNSTGRASGDAEFLIGGTCLNIDPVAGLSKFLVGSEAGHIIHCNRKNKPSERVTQVLIGHNGPVHSINRSPFFGKFFISCADWSCKIWADDIRTPILTTAYSPGSVNACCFSNTRPGVFATARSDGYLDIYDLFYKVDTPTLSCNVGNASLCSLEIDPTGEFLLLGANDGAVNLLQMSSGLHTSTNMVLEKQFIQNLFERESKREKALEQRTKEMKLKSADTAPKGPRDIDIVIDPDLLANIEDEYGNFTF